MEQFKREKPVSKVSVWLGVLLASLRSAMVTLGDMGNMIAKDE